MGLPKLEAAGRELLSIARQAWLLRHDITEPVIPEEGQDGDHVVICLHGLFATAGVLRPLRQAFERHRGIRTATFSYPVGPGIAALAEKLHALMAKLPERSHVHLLGHSVGGIVARYYVEEFTDSRIAQTISLAAPFAGVRYLGRLGLAITGDVAPGSPLLRHISLASRKPDSVPHLSLVAENDAVVAAPLAHALPGGEVKLVRKCGHNTMIYHPEATSIATEQVLTRASELSVQL